GLTTLTGPRFNLTKSVTITGPGYGFRVLDGNGGRQLFFVDGATTPGINVTIQGLQLQSGAANNSPVGFNTARGGAIFNEQGTLTIRDCYLGFNAATHG